MRWLAAVLALAACHRQGAPHVVVEVETEWPGRSPELMASAIATPLERALGQLPHVVAMTSASREGRAVVHVEIEGDRDHALVDVRKAIEASMRLLPSSLPSPPLIRTPGETVARYLVPQEQAELASLSLERARGVMAVRMCGRGVRREEIVVDPARLAAAGLTLADLRQALAAVNVNVPAGAIDAGRRDDTLAVGDTHEGLHGSEVLAYRNGAPVRLDDVAQLRDVFAPTDCVLAPRGMVELDVHALQRDTVEHVTVEGVKLLPVPLRPELHGELDPALTPEAALARVADAVGSEAVAEIRGRELVVRGASPRVVDRLRRTVGVAVLGDRTATVHVSGADPQQIAATARAIADRLHAADLLVAAHGLANAPVQQTEVDRDAAARLGVTSAQIDDILATARGRVVSTIFTQQQQIAVVIRVDDTSQLLARGTDNALVPLASLVRITSVPAPLEILHRGQFPAVDLEVRGDPHAAIGTVPAGVRVEVERD